MTTHAPKEAHSQLDQLYRQAGALIYRRCLRLLKDPDLAEDATQDVFLKVVSELSQLREAEKLLPWLYRTATHHCLDIITSAGRRARRETDVTQWEVHSSSPLEAYPDKQLAASILAEFDRETQTIVIGVLVDGMQQQEIAKALGISRRTVARKLDLFTQAARDMILRSAS